MVRLDHGNHGKFDELAWDSQAVTRETESIGGVMGRHATVFGWLAVW